MKNSMKDFKKLIKTIFNDVLFLYNNFIHWNISKIIISLSTFVLGIITFLPFFFVVIFLMWIDPIVWKDIFHYSEIGISPDLVHMIQDNIFIVFLELIFLLLGFVVFFLTVSYKIILQLYLTKSYLNNTLLPYKKNLYFNKEAFILYIKIFAWQSFYFLIPLGIFIFGLILLGIIFSFSGGLGVNLMSPPFIFSLLSIIFISVCALVFVYLVYKMSFSFFIMLDSIDNKNADMNEKGEKKTMKIFSFFSKKTLNLNSKEVIQKSFSLTRGYHTFLTIASTFVIFGFIMLPFFGFSAYVEKEIETMTQYINLSYKQEQKKINEDDLANLENLKLLYSDMNILEVKKKLGFFNAMEIIYSIFIFLVFNGYMEMVFYSLYNNYIKKQKV
ncbi:hypothetical protein HGA92_05440 [Candidatus Gracilibacteria bacterium]|nr:hypothetical protein [Candidatus Gracilibacteria bacterium]NUJ99075.1 hypothetical protein [Candidatus Gracilibacteria bacterium]